MLTTAGVTALAMLRNVSALSAPVIGALFIGGTVIVCAIEPGVRSRRDASTIPTASDATTMTGTYKSVIFRVDILFSIQQLSAISHQPSAISHQPSAQTSDSRLQTYTSATISFCTS